MKNLNLLVLLLLLGLSSFTALSQGLQTEIKIVRPDISGKWKLNVEKTRWPSGNGSTKKMLAQVSWIMIVEQKLPIVSIAVKVQREGGDNEKLLGGQYTLYADGRGDEYPAARSSGATSVTRWTNNKLVTTIYSGSTKDPDHVSRVEEYELSADGNSLVQSVKCTGSICGVSFGLNGGFDDTKTGYAVFDRIK